MSLVNVIREAKVGSVLIIGPYEKGNEISVQESAAEVADRLFRNGVKVA